MKMGIFKRLACLWLILFLMTTGLMASSSELTKGQAKEYIMNFINVSLYAVPYSEPLSVLLSSHSILELGLHTWLNSQQQKAWNDYDDALDSGASQDQLRRLMDKADRVQAIYSCIFSKDPSRLRKIEARDRKRNESTHSTQSASLFETGSTSDVLGSWEFGRNESDRIGTIILTKTPGKYGAFEIGGYHHVNESYWNFEGQNTIIFKHTNGQITTRFRRVDPKLWKGQFVPPKDWPPMKKPAIHYLKRK